MSPNLEGDGSKRRRCSAHLACNNEVDDYIRHAYKCTMNAGEEEPKDIHICSIYENADIANPGGRSNLKASSVDEAASEGMGQPFDPD